MQFIHQTVIYFFLRFSIKSDIISYIDLRLCPKTNKIIILSKIIIRLPIFSYSISHLVSENTFQISTHQKTLFFFFFMLDLDPSKKFKQGQPIKNSYQF